MLHHIIYLSGATVAFNEQQLQQLLRQDSSQNQTLGVTGMLRYGQEQFLQVLEVNKPRYRLFTRTSSKAHGTAT